MQGRRDHTDAAQAAIPGITVKDRVRLRGARAADRPAELDLAAGDIVELTTKDGVRLWMRPDELPDRLVRDVVRNYGAGGGERS